MTPGQLVRAVAAALDLPEPVVAQYDRRLSEEGFRTKGGRGSSAPQVEPEDVAKLVIAALSGERYANTFATVRDLWNATLDSAPQASGRDGFLGAVVLEKQIEGTLGNFATAKQNTNCSFGEGLTAVINDCINGQMEAFLGPKKSDWRAKFQLKVTRPWAEAYIGFSDGENVHLDFRFQGTADNDINREVITTHEVTAIPLLRIAEQMRK